MPNHDDALTDDQEIAVLRCFKAAGQKSVRRSFSVEQRQELEEDLGLFAEQVRRLESNALQSISWRMVPSPHMADVREKLSGLANLLNRVERLYVKLSTIPTGANRETVSWLYMAQEALGFDPLESDEQDKLHDSLETATSIVRRALEDLPKVRRSTARRSTEFVRLIMKALRLGHAEHFRCSGYGDTPPESEPMPEFRIEVARGVGHRGRPFPRVAEIVAEASGGWSADDAIRACLKEQAASVGAAPKRRARKIRPATKSFDAVITPPIWEAAHQEIVPTSHD